MAKSPYGRVYWDHYLPVMDQMTVSDYRVWHLLLWHYNRKTKRCNPSYNVLTDESGLCRDSVIVAVRHLETLGLIRIRKYREAGGRIRNQYDLAGDW